MPQQSVLVHNAILMTFTAVKAKQSATATNAHQPPISRRMVSPTAFVLVPLALPQIKPLVAMRESSVRRLPAQLHRMPSRQM